MKLYEINKEIDEILSNAIDENGEISEESAIALNLLEIAKENKLLDIACYIKSLQAEVEAHRVEEQKQRNTRQSKENQINWLKQYVKSSIEIGQKLSDSRISISTRQTPPSVELLKSPEELPEQFVKTTFNIVPDKSLIKNYIKNLESENKTCNFARLNNGWSITIK